VGFVVDKVALGQISSEYFGFSCQSFRRLLHTHHHSGLIQPATGGLCSTSAAKKKKKKKNLDRIYLYNTTIQVYEA
jgi:hypothetical protein